MMKKIFIFFQLILVATFWISCSSSKEARGYRKTISGSWQLKTVVSEGIMGKIKAQIFNEEDFNCFIGSTWNFTSGNSLGSYTISKNADECAAIKRNIRWSIYEPSGAPKEFQFKRLDNKYKEIDPDKGGFRFLINQLDENRMQLKSQFEFEGKTVSLTYNFERI